MALVFPGMDPYLEGSLWTTLHFGLGAEIVRQLAPKLRPRYLALPVERLIMDTPDSIVVTTSSIYPDVGVISNQRTIGETAVTWTTDTPLQIPTVIPAEIPHVTIEIRDAAERQLVTAIELLSPTNKRGQNYEKYLTKRQRILFSTVHLLEVDLLREGKRVPMQQSLPKAPYFVFLSRAEKRPISDVWPIHFDDPLPTVPIPLLPDDTDVELDMQQAFANTYGLHGYDLIIDYSQPPEVALDEEAAAWVDAYLQRVGVRPSKC